MLCSTSNSYYYSKRKNLGFLPLFVVTNPPTLLAVKHYSNGKNLISNFKISFFIILPPGVRLKVTFATFPGFAESLISLQLQLLVLRWFDRIRFHRLQLNIKRSIHDVLQIQSKLQNFTMLELVPRQFIDWRLIESQLIDRHQTLKIQLTNLIFYLT